jgi:hypothetical protein
MKRLVSVMVILAALSASGCMARVGLRGDDREGMRDDGRRHDDRGERGREEHRGERDRD